METFDHVLTENDGYRFTTYDSIKCEKNIFRFDLSSSMHFLLSRTTISINNS